MLSFPTSNFQVHEQPACAIILNIQTRNRRKNNVAYLWLEYPEGDDYHADPLVFEGVVICFTKWKQEMNHRLETDKENWAEYGKYQRSSKL